MGLLQNGFRDQVGVFRIYGAGTSNGAYPYTLPSNRHLTGMQRNLAAGEGISSTKVGIPSGHLAPSSWMLPQKTGAMTAFTSCRGVGAATGVPAAGIGITGQADGVGSATADNMALAWGSGSSAGTGASEGEMMGLGITSGYAAGTGSAEANIFAAVAVTGLAGGSCTVSGEGYLAISLTGLAEGTCTVSGESAALINTSGAAAGSSTVEADVVGAYFATGLAEGAGTAEGGDPVGLGWMAGTAPGSCTATAGPSALGFMSGSTDAASGELTVDAIATATADAVWSYERG